MDTLFAIGSLLLIWSFLFVVFLPRNENEMRYLPLYALFEFILVGAVIGIMRHELPFLFKLIVWPTGFLAWLLILICLSTAHHNGKNIWLLLFKKGSFSNWL